MSPRGDDVAGHLADVVMRLDGIGLVDMLHQQIADAWRTNMDRYEPSRLGDTLRAFGFLSAENIQQRVLMECQGAASRWYERDVRVSTPDNSMLIAARGVELHVMKAPAGQSRTPDWAASFTWNTESATRQRCARRNSELYRSSFGTVTDGSLFALPEAPRVDRDATRCRDVFLVWSGDVPTGLTAGWLGLPCEGERPWLAVQRLWWDEPDGSVSESETELVVADSPGTFDALQAPSAPVRLKPRRPEEGSR